MIAAIRNAIAPKKSATPVNNQKRGFANHRMSAVEFYCRLYPSGNFAVVGESL